MSGAGLTLSGVWRRFPSGAEEVAVLKDVSLNIRAGEMVAIIGASGSGKSTLMNILGCLDQPSAGRYQVGGRGVSELDSDQLATLRREHFGFIFQRYHLLPHLSAIDNVAMPAVYAGIGHERGASERDSCWRGWAWPARRTSVPASCPAVSNSGCPSRGR